MNKENILRLADHIEKLPHVAFASKSGFNMSSFRHKCGTPACIAGHADALASGFGANDKIPSGTQLVNRARNWLGLEEETAEMLFSPLFYPRYLEKITPVEAALVLRNLAKIGKVDWMIIL